MLTKNFIHNIVNFVSKLTKNFTYHIVNFFSKLDQISHFFAIKSKNWPFMQNFSFNLNLQIQSKFYPLNTNFYSNSTKISLVITHRFYSQITNFAKPHSHNSTTQIRKNTNRSIFGTKNANMLRNDGRKNKHKQKLIIPF